MRIVHLINGLGTGGGERLLAMTVTRMSGREHRVYCLTRLGVIADRLRARGVPVRRLSWGGVPSPFGWLRLAADLAHADVLHSHFFYSDLVASVLGRALRVRRRISTRHDVGYWMNRCHIWLEPRIYSGFHRVACVSEAVRERLRARGVVAEAVVLPPGIELENGDGDPGIRGPYLLSVGRLEAVKGHDLLVRAFARARLPGWRLVVAGDGRERGALETLARSEGVADRCDLLGEVSPARVSSLLGGARLFALPSRSEALPLALLEAMAAGVACVATRVGGVPEVVSHRRNGWLVPSDDVDALVDALETLARDEALSTELARAARSGVEEKFSIDAYIAAVEGLYA